LRAALDVLRDFGVAAFERRAPGVLRDPWAARDAYVDVVIGARTRDEFAADWVTGERATALALLEAQHQAMLMYTSCGWFFHDLAGIETIQVLRHAHRAVALLEELGERPPVAEFLAVLATANSNDPAEGNGRQIWAHHVEPVAARLAADQRDRAAAELARQLTDTNVALVADRLEELATLVDRDGTIPRELRTAVTHACQRAVDDAVAKAIGDTSAVDAALAAITLARRLDAPIDIERAQELVYERLLSGPAALEPLGRALYLAVGSLGHPE
jgi:hypothetical protein